MTENSTARMATVPQLLATVVRVYLDPPPKPPAFRAWLKNAGVPVFKSNPMARRGGGLCYYSVAATERMLQNRTRKAGSR